MRQGEWDDIDLSNRRGAQLRMEEASFTFLGRLEPESFLEFARHRARRLDIALTIGACSAAAIELSVAGDEVLVDAFEMACSLGPYGCIILDVVRTGH